MDDVKQRFKTLVHDEESGGFIHSNHCTDTLSEKQHQMKDVFNRNKHTSSEERAGKSSKSFSIDSLALKLASNKDYVCHNKTKTSMTSNTSDENAGNKQTTNTYVVFTENRCSNQNDPLRINKEVDGLSTIIKEIYERSLWRDKHFNDSMKTWTDGGSHIVEETNTVPEICENGSDKPEKLHIAKLVHLTGDGKTVNPVQTWNRQVTVNENNIIETDGDSYHNYRWKIKALEPVNLAHGTSATFPSPHVNIIHEELSTPSPTGHTSNVIREELPASFPNQDMSNVIREELSAPSPTQYISNIIRVPNKPSFIEDKYEHFSRNVEIFLTKDSPTLKSKSSARAKEMSAEDQTSESCLGQNGEIVCANNPEENLTKTGNEKPYVCDICNRSFSQNGHLNRHMRIHTGDKPFQCDVCGKEFSQSGDKRRHERTHTSFRPYQCFICDKEFNQSGHLQRHLRIHAGHILYNNGEFDKELTRQKYTEEKEAAKDKTKKCPLCEKTFIKKYLLDRHVRSHTGETPYKCEECGKGFTRKDRLQTHTRIHTGDKPYVCKKCGKGFNQSSHLKTHIRIHTGDKPYKCGVCGRGFAQSHDRKKHLRVHTGERPYICPLCGKDFNDNSQLWRHTRTHDDFDQSEGTSYKCQICDNEYEYSSQLLQHMKDHAEIGHVEVPSLDEFQQDSEMEEVRLTAEALLKKHTGYHRTL